MGLRAQAHWAGPIWFMGQDRPEGAVSRISLFSIFHISCAVGGICGIALFIIWFYIDCVIISLWPRKDSRAIRYMWAQYIRAFDVRGSRMGFGIIRKLGCIGLARREYLYTCSLSRAIGHRGLGSLIHRPGEGVKFRAPKFIRFLDQKNDFQTHWECPIKHGTKRKSNQFFRKKYNSSKTFFRGAQFSQNRKNTRMLSWKVWIMH